VAPTGQPVAAGATAGPRLADLRDQLRQAVDAENFELAARLRDRIRELE
jgi:protein-arginine kinase activator protein McsA